MNLELKDNYYICLITKDNNIFINNYFLNNEEYKYFKKLYSIISILDEFKKDKNDTFKLYEILKSCENKNILELCYCICAMNPYMKFIVLKNLEDEEIDSIKKFKLIYATDENIKSKFVEEI